MARIGDWRGWAGAGARRLADAGLTPRRAALLAAASALILACAPAQYFGRQHDDIMYFIAAQALSEGSYRLFTSPGGPPLTFVTPGFPLLLQPVVWLAGDNPAAYQAFCALLLAAVPWALWAWLRRSVDDGAALPAALFCAASPLTLSQSGTVMPEAAYALIFALLLYALAEERHIRHRGLIGPLLLLLVQTRPAGLSAVPAAAAAEARRRRWGPLLATLAWPAAGTLGWSLWCRARAGAAQEIFEWRVSYEAGPAQTLRLAADNALFFARTLGSCFLPPTGGDGAAAAALGVALLALAAFGAARRWRREPACPEAWALATAAGMHLLWGWRYERYWLPLLPLLCWGLASALGRRAPALLGGLLGLQLVFHGGRALAAAPSPELSRSYRWLSAQAAPADVIASLLYVRDGYYCGRPSVPLAPSRDAAELAQTLKTRAVRWVLWQDEVDLGLSAAPRSKMAELIAAARAQLRDPRHFRLVHRDDEERASVYALR